MKVLVTGINGFVGKYLAKILPTYFSSCKIDLFGTYFGENNIDTGLESICLHKLDITNKCEVDRIISEIKPDLLFHLAGQSSVGLSWKNPKLTMDVNVGGTINLLEAMKEYNKDGRILIVGSSEQYGKVGNVAISEEYRLNPQNPYAVSKSSQEQIAQLYANAYHMSIVMTRSFNHIGPMQEPIFVVSDWAKQIAEIEKGTKEPLLKVGNIDVKRDFTDVRDIVKAYILLIEKGVSGSVYNVGFGTAICLKDILAELISCSRVKIDYIIDKDKLRPVENEVIQCDNTKIRELCSWKPDYNIKDTLLDVLNYWRETI